MKSDLSYNILMFSLPLIAVILVVAVIYLFLSNEKRYSLLQKISKYILEIKDLFKCPEKYTGSENNSSSKRATKEQIIFNKIIELGNCTSKILNILSATLSSEKEIFTLENKDVAKKLQKDFQKEWWDHYLKILSEITLIVSDNDGEKEIAKIALEQSLGNLETIKYLEKLKKCMPEDNEYLENMIRMIEARLNNTDNRDEDI